MASEIKPATDSDPQFNELISIYENSIPRRERRKREDVLALLQGPNYLGLTISTGKTIAAFALVYVVPDSSVALLDYMAVRADCRSKGLGAAIFNETLERLSGRYLLIEVDSERETSSDLDLRLRRKAFYRRLGCQQIKNLDYALPLKDQEPAPLMDLMVHLNGRRPHISISELKRWLELLFVGIYARTPEDPLITKMLSGLKDPVALD